MDSGEDKRQKILETAKKVFAEKSFFDATLEEISELSGVKKSTIYYYFESKLDLLMTLLERVIQQVASNIDELITLPQKEDLIRSFIDHHFDFFAREREFVLLFHRVGFDLLTHPEACQRMQQILTHLQTIWDKLAARLGTMMTKKGTPISGEKLVRMISASIVGYCVEEIKRGEKIELEEREVFKEMFTSIFPKKEGEGNESY